MLKRSSLAPNEDYATVADLLATDDRPEFTLRIWGKPIRVRGLDLFEREEVRATCWRDDGQRDTARMVREYIRLGVRAPSLNEAQAEQFCRKHAGSIDQLYNFINDLTELDYDLIMAQALALAGLAPGTEPASAGGEQGGNQRSVGGSPSKARRRKQAGAA